MRFFLLILALTWSMLTFAPSNVQALPKNFRTVDTFYVGAMPDVDDIDEFRVLGIGTIISLHQLPPEVKKRAISRGITLYSFPLRTRLINISEIVRVMREAPENSVYLHCLHGADRTGAVTAYWLSTERNVDPFAALASVISPSEYHIEGLRQLGREYGVCLYPNDEAWVGKYSGAKNGGLEGLKICGDHWYTRLARNYLSITVGPPINARNERFWKKHNPNDEAHPER